LLIIKARKMICEKWEDEQGLANRELGRSEGNIMDTFSLTLEVIDKTNSIELDGIKFTDCVFVRPIINGNDLLKSKEMLGSVLWFVDLERSAITSGKYLIFTCVCGIAEDAGWDYVDVKHSGEVINWTFIYDKQYKFSFPKEQYMMEIDKIKNKLTALGQSVEIVPEEVCMPNN
jgi:hypothetical protein